MPGLQEWIYKLEVGEGTRWVKWVFLFLALLGLGAVYDIREYKCFNTQEAMDAAQLGRNLAENKGFTTEFIRPLSVYMIQQHELQAGIKNGTPLLQRDHPDLANPPVYPLLLAGLMKVFPFNFEISKGSIFGSFTPEVWIGFFNQFIFLASLVVLYALGRRLFDATVAALAAAVFATADLFWRFSLSGLSTHLLVLIFLLITWCLVAMEARQREEKGTGGWFFLMAVTVGLLLGLGTLTRYSFGWLTLPVLLFVAMNFGQRRAYLGLATLATFSLVLVPWMARNYEVCGNVLGTAGFALFHEMGPFPGNRLERFLTTDFDSALVKVDENEIIRKLLVNLATIMQEDLPKLGGSWLTAFFLAGLLMPFRNPGLSRLRLFLVASLATFMVAQALGRTNLSTMAPQVNSENLLVILAPLVFVFGMAMVTLIVDAIELPFAQLRSAINALILVVLAAPLILTLLPPRGFPLAYPPYWPPLIQDTANFMKKDEMMMSDMPWAVAWYGHRKCLWLTLDAPNDKTIRSRKSDYFSINDYQKPIQGLYLTRVTTDGQFFSQILLNPDWAWGKFLLDSLLATNVPTGFPLKYSPPYYLREGQLFLSDFPRWKKQSQ